LQRGQFMESTSLIGRQSLLIGRTARTRKHPFRTQDKCLHFVNTNWPKFHPPWDRDGYPRDMISTGTNPLSIAPQSFVKRARRPLLESQANPVNSTQDISDLAQIAQSPVFLKLGKQIIRLPLDGQPAQLGRTEESPLQFKSLLVSRRHAEFRANNGSLEVRDLNSTNGTFIGDEKIKPGEWHKLEDGQKMNLGGVALEWRNTARDRHAKV
jgi:FHA domain